jgi:hypothetical protein
VRFLVCASLLPLGVQATTITFSESGLGHGDFVSNQISGVTISAINPNRGFDVAQIFDTTASPTSDTDLEDPWSTGNLPSTTVLGNALIISENNDPNDPDDEGRRPAGSLTLDFAASYQTLGFDLIDVEDLTAENGSVDFFAAGGATTNVTFADLVTRDGTITWGDNSANRIAPFSASELGLPNISKVTFNLGGSGAIDNITVPDGGSTLALLGLSMAGLGFCKRQGKRA